MYICLWILNGMTVKTNSISVNTVLILQMLHGYWIKGLY